MTSPIAQPEGPPPRNQRGGQGNYRTGDGPASRIGIFEAFRSRGFRFQWPSDGFTVWATEMEALILGWFVLVETDSPFLLGLVGALRFLGTLFGPIYGVVVDRISRRKLLTGIRGFFAVLATVTLSLALTDQLAPWHAFIIATLIGFGRMFDNVVRQSLIADVVPRGALMNALGLSRSMQDGAKITGALAGGLLLESLGLGSSYLLVLGLYVGAVFLTFGITLRRTPAPRHAASAWGNLLEGARYMRSQETIVGMMFLAFLVNVTSFPLANGLMPVLARDVFDMGPGGLATLMATLAAGALAGSVVTAVMGRSGRPARTVVIAILAWHLGLLVLANLSLFGAALIALLFVGFFSSFSMVAMATVLLTITPAEFRGRVMGVRSLAVWGMLIGLLGGGMLVELFSVSTTLMVAGIGGLSLTVWAVIKWPQLWDDRDSRSAETEPPVSGAGASPPGDASGARTYPPKEGESAPSSRDSLNR